MGQVKSVSTPANLSDLATAVLALAPGIFPELTREGARILLAHLAFETGHGKKLRNNNPGNMMAGGFFGSGENKGEEYMQRSGDWYRPTWFADESSPNHALMLAGKQPSAFQSFKTLKIGVQKYLKLIDGKPALAAALKNGSPQEFAAAIKTSGYTHNTPASLPGTLSSMVSGYKDKKYFVSLPSGGTGSSASGDYSEAMGIYLLGLVGVGAFVFLKRRK